MSAGQRLWPQKIRCLLLVSWFLVGVGASLEVWIVTRFRFEQHRVFCLFLCVSGCESKSHRQSLSFGSQIEEHQQPATPNRGIRKGGRPGH